MTDTLETVSLGGLDKDRVKPILRKVSRTTKLKFTFQSSKASLFFPTKFNSILISGTSKQTSDRVTPGVQIHTKLTFEC